MTIQHNKWIRQIWASWEKANIVHPLETLGQNLGCDAAVLTVCRKAGNFFPLKEAGRSSRASFAFANVCLNVCFISNLSSLQIQAVRLGKR
jgi:hypothetical protein